jgi:hypothetical protein
MGDTASGMNPDVMEKNWRSLKSFSLPNPILANLQLLAAAWRQKFSSRSTEAFF